MATKKTSGSRGRSERKADEEARSRPSPAARGATSAKGTMSGPTGKSKLSPHRGLIERAATAPTYHGPPIPSSIRIETRYPADPRRMVSLRITVIDHGGNEFEMSPRDLSDSESITLPLEDLWYEVK